MDYANNSSSILELQKISIPKSIEPKSHSKHAKFSVRMRLSVCTKIRIHVSMQWWWLFLLTWIVINLKLDLKNLLYPWESNFETEEPFKWPWVKSRPLGNGIWFILYEHLSSTEMIGCNKNISVKTNKTE